MLLLPPLIILVLLFLLLLLPVLLILLPIRIVEAALGRLGIPGPLALLLFLASLLGSFVNIPILGADEGTGRLLLVPGLQALGPLFDSPAYPQQVLAVNVGGALVPLLICLFLLPRAPLARTLMATAVMVLVCYLVARPVPEVGITIPTFLPPLAAVLCAFIFSPGRRAPVAYISGVLGVLIGADLLHLADFPPGPGFLSIGGAGVFDGIFLVGIMAALFA